MANNFYRSLIKFCKIVNVFTEIRRTMRNVNYKLVLQV